MSGAETARRPDVQRRIGGAQTAAQKWPSSLIFKVNISERFSEYIIWILVWFTRAFTKEHC